MSVQAFSVSTEAAAWILEALEEGAKDLEKEADGMSLVPILCYAIGYQRFDKDYKTLLERCGADHFFLGWDSAKEMDPGGFHQIEIGGFKVFVQHITLKALEGKEMILETVDVGYPIPASKNRQLLRAKKK